LDISDSATCRLRAQPYSPFQPLFLEAAYGKGVEALPRRVRGPRPSVSVVVDRPRQLNRSADKLRAQPARFTCCFFRGCGMAPSAGDRQVRRRAPSTRLRPDHLLPPRLLSPRRGSPESAPNRRHPSLETPFFLSTTDGSGLFGVRKAILHVAGPSPSISPAVSSSGCGSGRGPEPRRSG
jgi:hypothetical protein